MDSGNQATGGSSMTTTDGDKDDNLLLTSIFHFEKKSIRNTLVILLAIIHYCG